MNSGLSPTPLPFIYWNGLVVLKVTIFFIKKIIYNIYWEFLRNIKPSSNFKFICFLKTTFPRTWVSKLSNSGKIHIVEISLILLPSFMVKVKVNSQGHFGL